MKDRGSHGPGDAHPLPWRRLTLALVGLGVALRLAHYLACPSLWFDEAALALNILERSFGGLLQPLDDAQVAPVGFLAATKLLALVLGEGELVLRLPSLVAGVVSLVLVVKLARRLLPAAAVPMAAGLFAVSSSALRYSSEVKQYASDAAIALLLCLAAAGVASQLERGDLRTSRAVAFGALGACCPWFSQPAVFVLAGIGVTLAVDALRRRDRAAMAKLLLSGAMWLASFAVLYAVSLRDALANPFLAQFWGGGDEPGARKGSAFMPLPPTSLADLAWFGRAFLGLFDRAAGLPLAAVAALAFLVGAAAMLRRRTRAAALLLAPLAACLLASGLRVYPFYGRLLLFAAPAVILTIAAGSAAAGRVRTKLPVLQIALVALLFLPPAAEALAGAVRHAPTWDARSVIAYIQRHRAAGDVLYVYYGAQTQMRYYARRLGIGAHEYRLGTCSRQDFRGYERDLDGLPVPGRTWILLSHQLAAEKKLFLDQLERRGTRLDAFRSGYVEAHLFALDRR